MDEIAPSLAIEDVVKMTSDAEREKSPEPPTPDQTAIGGRTLAIESVEIDFIGKSSHAGLAPEDGINALDAVCAFYQMVNIQKQYYPETNVHGVILETGKKASGNPGLHESALSEPRLGYAEHPRVEEDDGGLC